MHHNEKINLTQVCKEFAPVFKLTAEGLAHLGLPFEKDRSAVLFSTENLPMLAEALAHFAMAKRDELLGIKKPEPDAPPRPAVQWLPADDTEGGSI
ncbi:hypothetical protein [Delftia sp. PS-11]|uniref:hypothetical protein n=1 Tax=Delftia sp. PS-11 TaxID=2767222 RepID=UPI002453F320|nr:hypothetical protein [Delftia sp. PS-11]KAJ8741789.1 hypothetical protein H9T68_20725 [Delftia sp. PS-11]